MKNTVFFSYVLGIFVGMSLSISSGVFAAEATVSLPVLIVPSPNERDHIHGFPIDGYSECNFDSATGASMYDLRCHRVFEDYYRRLREKDVLYNLGNPAYDRARAARWFKTHPQK